MRALQSLRTNRQIRCLQSSGSLEGRRSFSANNKYRLIRRLLKRWVYIHQNVDPIRNWKEELREVERLIWGRLWTGFLLGNTGGNWEDKSDADYRYKRESFPSRNFGTNLYSNSSKWTSNLSSLEEWLEYGTDNNTNDWAKDNNTSILCWREGWMTALMEAECFEPSVFNPWRVT